MVHYLCVLFEPGTVKHRSQKVSVGSEGLFTLRTPIFGLSHYSPEHLFSFRGRRSVYHIYFTWDHMLFTCTYMLLAAFYVMS